LSSAQEATGLSADMPGLARNPIVVGSELINLIKMALFASEMRFFDLPKQRNIVQSFQGKGPGEGFRI
jgi:hypothetical protein